jgi:hypothetical protein
VVPQPLLLQYDAKQQEPDEHDWASTQAKRHAATASTTRETIATEQGSRSLFFFLGLLLFFRDRSASHDAQHEDFVWVLKLSDVKNKEIKKKRKTKIKPGFGGSSAHRGAGWRTRTTLATLLQPQQTVSGWSLALGASLQLTLMLCVCVCVGLRSLQQNPAAFG